jgi:hypothetical protein
MGIFSFYSVRKPRQFDYKPLYYNPRKEAMEERKLRIKRELGMEIPDEEYKPQIKGTFVQGTTHLKKNQLKGYDARSRRDRNVRLSIFLVLLVLALWFFFWR